MATREEIREVLNKWADDGCLYPDRVCNALGSGYCSSGEESYKCLMGRLTQIGVVIKVDRELPGVEFFDCANIRRTKDMTLASNHTINLMLKWHNDSLKPLVEE